MQSILEIDTTEYSWTIDPNGLERYLEDKYNLIPGKQVTIRTINGKHNIESNTISGTFMGIRPVQDDDGYITYHLKIDNILIHPNALDYHINLNIIQYNNRHYEKPKDITTFTIKTLQSYDLLCNNISNKIGTKKFYIYNMYDCFYNEHTFCKSNFNLVDSDTLKVYLI
jgi:hypothetical protein